MSNYKWAIKRLEDADSVDKLNRVWGGLVNVHIVGHLSDQEIMRLDRKLCKRLDELQQEETA